MNSKIFDFCLLVFFFLFTFNNLAQYPQLLWTYDLNAPSFGSAAVADIDADGNLEIVFGTYFNDEKIHALNAEDGTVLWTYNTGGCNDASPAIADVDQDGELEVIVPASSPSTVFCLDGDSGTVEWSASTGVYNCIDSPPAIEDIDNDGKPEIILGTFNGYIYCFNGEDGSQLWRSSTNCSAIQSAPNIVDLDGNGTLEVVVTQWGGDYRVYALNGNDGSTFWYSDLPNDHMYHGGSFADIDRDGKPEIVISSYDNHIYVLNGEDGSELWNYNTIFYAGAPTSIADLNKDEHLEIVYAAYNTLGVLSHSGNLIWSYPTGGSIFRGAAISDINNDDTLDVVFGSGDGLVRVCSGSDGDLIWSYDIQAQYGTTMDIDNAPVIADFDNDGKLDVFIVGGVGTSSTPQNNYGRAYAFSAGDGNGPGWPMFRHNLRHSAGFGDIWTGINDRAVSKATNFQLKQNYPNPFNNSTIFEIVIPENGILQIQIFDITGKKVFDQYIGDVNPAVQKIQWNGLSNAGNQVASGVYFYRYIFERKNGLKNIQTRKMMLMR